MAGGTYVRFYLVSWLGERISKAQGDPGGKQKGCDGAHPTPAVGRDKAQDEAD